MELTVFDWVFVVLIGALTVWDLWRGFSGQLGSCAWLVTMYLVIRFGYAPAARLVGPAAGAETSGGLNLAAVAAVVVVALIAALVVSYAVKRLVSVLIPQPFNAILGAAAGLAKGVLALAILAGAGIADADARAEGFFVQRSRLVAIVSGYLP